MRFQREDGAAVPWLHTAWCLTLQAGYSILQVKVNGDTSEFDLALTALADVSITTTADLPPPEFPYDAERDDLTSFWSQQFTAWDVEPYIAPSHVTFTDEVASACGPSNPLDIGVAYCTADNAIFVDVAAVNDMGNRYGRGINVFVLAHETGHHVAWLLGYTEQCTLSECLDEINDVQFELMADCFAGAWMANAEGRGIITMDDVEDMLVGVADSFSDSGHGTSALRLWWLLQGFHGGADVCFQPEEE
jgi:predicted metalloprotease